GAELDAAPPLKCVIPPRAVMHTVGDRFSELAVVGDIDAELALMPHDICYRRGEQFPESRLIARLTGFLLAVRLDKRVRTRQTADMAGQDTIGAVAHVALLSATAALSRARRPARALRALPRRSADECGRRDRNRSRR